MLTKEEGAAIASIALHACLLLGLVNVTDKGQPQPPKQSQVDLIAGDVQLMPKDERTLDPNALNLSCPDTYEGIGIKRRWGGMVTEVAPGWPADRAGIKVGDIVEPWLFYPENGFMEFEVHRGQQVVKMRLKTEKICFRDSPF